MLLMNRTRPGLWDLFRQMETLRDRLEGSYADAEMTRVYPPINIWTSKEGAMLTAETPGIEPEDVDIQIQDKSLTIHIKRLPTELKDGEKWHRQERGSGETGRTIELPFAVDAEKVNAKFAKGILEITLPRAESERPRKITVQSN